MNQLDISDIFNFPRFGGFSIATIFSKPVLALILLAYFVGYCVLSGVLFYHWRAYGMGSKKIYFAETVFILVSMVLFVFAGVSITYN